MTPEPTLGVVIVNYNGRRFLIECLRGLFGGTRSDFEVALVDNASSDGSVEEVTREFPSVTVFRQGENRGMATGNNIGIEHFRQRGFEYVLLLNYDTLPDARLLEELLAAAGPGVLVSGYTVFWDDERRSNCHAGGFDWRTGRLKETFFGRSDDGMLDVQTVDMVDGCCLLIPRAVFDAIGMMDASYFLYYDDTDFVVRARRAGFTCLLNPRARLKHYERGASAGRSSISVYYSTRNRPYFMAKHCHSRLEFYGFQSYFYVTRAAHMVKWLVLGDFELIWSMLKALGDYQLGRMGAGHISARPAGASA